MIGRKVVCLFAISVLISVVFSSVTGMEAKEMPLEEGMDAGNDRFLIIGFYSNVGTDGDGNPSVLYSPYLLLISGLNKEPDTEPFPYWPYCSLTHKIVYVNSCMFGLGVPKLTGGSNEETGESGFIFAICTEVYSFFP